MPTGRPCFAFLGLGVPTDWVTHRIAVELTALWGIEHGRTLSIIQPWLLRETLAAIETLYRSLDMPVHLRDAALGTHAEIDAEKTERIIRAACGG